MRAKYRKSVKQRLSTRICLGVLSAIVLLMGFTLMFIKESFRSYESQVSQEITNIRTRTQTSSLKSLGALL